jgi:PAS domain S-box-containing protein
MKDRADQDLFRLITDKAGEEIYLIRSDGKLSYVNKAAAQSLGYTVSELLDIGIADLDLRFGPDFPAHFQNVISEKDLPPFRTEYKSKNGKFIPKEIKSVFLEFKGEKYVCSIAHDISYHLRMEKNLKISEERYRRLVENLQEEYFFYSHDTDGVFSYISPSITNILGYTQEEFLQHYTEYLTDHPINKYVVEQTNLSIRGIRQQSYEVEIYHNDGTPRRLEVSEVPVFDKEKKIGCCCRRHCP